MGVCLNRWDDSSLVKLKLAFQVSYEFTVELNNYKC